MQRGVDAGHQALAGGLFVAAGAVDLSGEDRGRRSSCLERAVELGRVDGVVLDGVAGAQHLGVFEAGDGRDHRQLHFHRQRRAHAVDVDLVRVQALGLEEDLVRGLVGKLDDLVFDGRAVPRTDATDLAAVHRRAMHVFANDRVRLRRGERDVAGNLRVVMRSFLVRKLKGVGSASPGCTLNCDQSMVRPSRRGGVPVLRRQSAEAELLECFAEHDCEAASPLRPAGYLLLAAMDESVEKSAGGDDDGAGGDAASVAENRRRGKSRRTP